jgi:U3 small nucleolar RNA-associated protein MPP10
MSSEQAEVAVPAELERLSTLVRDKPEAFAAGDESIRTSALTAAKYVFDMGAHNVLHVYCTI